MSSEKTKLIENYGKKLTVRNKKILILSHLNTSESIVRA